LDSSGPSLAWASSGVSEASVGADGLVGFLRALVRRAVEVGLFGEVLGAELFFDERPGHVERFARQVGRVGTHVGDVAGLVQGLGDAHRALGAVGEAAGGGLLERAGDEGARGLAGRALLLDGADVERRAVGEMAGVGGEVLRGTLGVGVLGVVFLVDDEAEISAALRASGLVVRLRTSCRPAR
jgi:hypothetical protein